MSEEVPPLASFVEGLETTIIVPTMTTYDSLEETSTESEVEVFVHEDVRHEKP